jgi:hypothetical protein
MKKKCPFAKFKPCIGDECELWEEEGWENNRTGESQILKACVLKLTMSHMREQTMKIQAMQKEMGETKTAVLADVLLTAGRREGGELLMGLVRKANKILEEKP